MSVELPPPEYWRCPRFGNDGALFRSRLQAVANGEQVCEALYTAEQIRAAVDAALEAAAKACEGERVDAEESGAAEDRCYNYATKHCAAAIRAMKAAQR